MLNGNYAADQIASWLAHALNEVLTDPYGDAWYDRYGLENAEKCEGTYGTTYTVTNPNGQSARANIRLGVRDFLLQQNWVNGKKDHCAMTPVRFAQQHAFRDSDGIARATAWSRSRLNQSPPRQ
jgi:hypothetical protein